MVFFLYNIFPEIYVSFLQYRKAVFLEKSYLLIEIHFGNASRYWNEMSEYMSVSVIKTDTYCNIFKYSKK